MKTWIKGLLVGVVVSFFIFIFLVAEATPGVYQRNLRKYEDFKKCQQCGMSDNTDCLIELCLETRPWFINYTQKTPRNYCAPESAEDEALLEEDVAAESEAVLASLLELLSLDSSLSCVGASPNDLSNS